MVRSRWKDTDAVAVAVLGASFLVVIVLLVQSLATIRSRDRMLAATLEDFAAFAGQNLAGELNTTFSSLFLDEIVRSRAAHYAWVAEGVGRVPAGRWSTPDGSIPVHFSIDENRVVAHDGVLDPEREAWILAAVVPHAQDVYPAPAPYALLRTDGPNGQRTVAYRKEVGYGETSLYGFVVDFSAFTPLYERVVRDTPTLPRSLFGAVEPEELLGVRLFFPQDGQVLFERNPTTSYEVVEATSIAAKAGRIAVHVQLDAPLARGRVTGGAGNIGIPFFVGLGLLTLALLAAAVGLMRRASRLNELREQFIANISHDLRTPLAQIRMFSETLLLDRITHPGERRRSLRIIGQQATHLSDLVDNVLHASGRATSTMQRVRTRLDRLLSETADAMTPTADEVGATISRDVDGPAEAVVDPTALRRILVNLLDNALKYGPRGQTVSVTLRNDGASLTVIVDDEGPGIPERDRAGVWERFSRLDRGRDATTGAGIGLSVVRDLATLHGGSVEMGESPAGGARVTVRLATGGRVGAGGHVPEPGGEEGRPDRGDEATP